MTKKIDLNVLLFLAKGNSTIMPSISFGSYGVSGIGYSAARPANANRPAKYSRVIQAVDNVLLGKVGIKKNVYDDTRYMEYHHSDGTIVPAIVTNSRISVSKEDYADIDHIALTLFVCKMIGTAKSLEVSAMWKKISADYKKTKTYSLKDALLLCDAFHYDIVLKQGFFEVDIDDSFVEGPVKQSFQKGVFSADRAFSSVDKPSLRIESGLKKESKKKKNDSEKSFLDECKSGKYHIAYSWSEEQKARIPDINTLDAYIPNVQFTYLVKKIYKRLNRCLERMDEGLVGINAILNDYVNCNILGRPGTGKTTTIYAVGAALGMPVYTINITDKTEEDEFSGKTKTINGNFQFVETDFLRGYENGGIIIMEEVNMGNPNMIMGALGQAIEKPFLLQKDGYIPVRRNPMTVLLTTMNVGTNGSNSVNQAFLGREKQHYILDDPEKDSFIKILASQGYKTDICKWVYTAYERTLNLLKSSEFQAEDVAMNLSTRTCLGALQNMEDGESPVTALENTIIGIIASSDLTLAEEVRKQVIELLPEAPEFEEL